jgi:hypothetical protein
MPKSKAQRRKKGAGRLRKRELVITEHELRSQVAAWQFIHEQYWGRPIRPLELELLTGAVTKMREESHRAQATEDSPLEAS